MTAKHVIAWAGRSFVAGVAALGLSLGSAMAQDSGGEGSQDGQQGQNGEMSQDQQPVEDIEVSDEELSTFVDAALEVRDVYNDYESDIESAEGEEREEMMRQRDEELRAAVEEAGLSVERYNTIHSAVTSNDALNQRYYEMVRERREEMDGGGNGGSEQ